MKRHKFYTLGRSRYIIYIIYYISGEGGSLSAYPLPIIPRNKCDASRAENKEHGKLTHNTSFLRFLPSCHCSKQRQSCRGQYLSAGVGRGPPCRNRNNGNQQTIIRKRYNPTTFYNHLEPEVIYISDVSKLQLI